MAGDRIKGITVEIGGDTQGLDKALKDVNKESSKLQRELNDVQRLLKFDPNNVELIAQKQKLLNDQITNTEKKLNKLKEAESQVQAQFERGDIGIEQYRAFQRELADTQSYLRNTQNSLNDMQQEQDNVAKSTREMSRLFEATGTSIEDFADAIGTRTVRAIQQGTASSRDLQRAFERISSETVGTSANIGDVRQALQRLESGEASINEVRRELQRMGGEARDVRGDIQDLGGELGGMVAGISAGMGLGAVFEKAMDMSEVDTVIEMTLDIPNESKQAIKNAIKTVGGYIDDNEAALEGVRKQFQLNASLTDEDNTRIVKGAGAIAKAYSSIDFTELIQETHEMALGMEMTHDEALGMTKALLDVGFPPDQLDIITEYGQQLTRAGYNAEDIQAIFAAGVETGTWNIDVLLDGLKEGRIILAEYGAGVDDATKDILKGTDISAKQLEKWGKAVAGGGEEGKNAMLDVADALSKVKDETKKNELGVKLYGTLWEENGENLIHTLLGAKDHTLDLAEGQRQLNEDTAKLDASPQQMLNQALQELWVTLAPLLLHVTNFVTVIADWISKNPELTAGIVAFVSILGILMGIFGVVIPIVMNAVKVFKLLAVFIGGISTPVLVVIGVIAALIAIGVLLYKNWDSVMKWGKKLMTSISASFSAMGQAVAKYMGKVLTDVKRIWGNVTGFFEGINLEKIGANIIKGLIKGIKSMAKAVGNAAKDIANGIGKKISGILKLGSPSKLTEEMGEFTGEGLVIGMKNSLSKVHGMAKKMGQMAIPEDINLKVDKGTVAPSSGKQLTVNLHSPKALDVRQASKEFNKTLNRMSLMW